MTIEKLFYLVAFLVGYTWIGYPAVLWVLRGILKRPVRCDGNGIPDISVIVAVHNEETQIAAKLENCLALDYPQDRFEIIVASDHSTDGTEQIVNRFARRDPRVRLIRSEVRAGKSGAQNLAAEAAGGEILVFTDAETRAWSTLLHQIAEDFEDPKVGLVAPVVHFGRYEDSVSQGQNAYWRYELFLRQLESDIGILATASGSALAVRRTLYRPVPRQYGDDCVIPLDVRLQGHRIVQDPRAIVYDTMPHSVNGELRTRVRMTARNWSGIFARRSLLNPLRFPGSSWGLVSHKFMRWLTPLFLLLLLSLNVMLALHGEMTLLAVLQGCFYAAAFAGWRRAQWARYERIFGYPFAFCLANLGFLLGTWKSLRGEKVEAYK